MTPLFAELKSYTDGMNNGEIVKANPIIRIILLIYGDNNIIQNRMPLPSSVDNTSATKIQ